MAIFEHKMERTMTQHELNTSLYNACVSNDFEKVKYLLTSPDLDKHAFIHFEEDFALRQAVSNGNLEMVKFLLTSPELKEKADITAKDNSAVHTACFKGRLEILKWLLTSPELLVRPDLSGNNYESFFVACIEEKKEIIQYLVFDYQIPLTEGLKNSLTNHDFTEELKLFQTRDMKNSLEETLKSQPVKQTKSTLGKV